MAFTFKKATKLESKGRIALTGPSGSGKTLTALKFARVLAGPTGRIAVIDTEKGSASKYSDKFDFDVLELTSFAPLTYVEAIKAAEAEGYDVIVVDSLTHAWSGKDGAMEQVDKIKARSRGGDGNGFTAWKDVTPMQNALIDAMTGSTAHVVATMRSKMEYVIEENAQGKKVPRKVGMAPEQRAGMEYEFDLVGDMDIDHRMVVSKSRCDELADAVVLKPGPETAETFKAWLAGAPRPAPVSNTTGGATTPPPPPPALVPFYAALPDVADPPAAAALWRLHRPAVEAVDEPDRKAARSAIVRRIVAFGGGVGTPDAARKFLTKTLAELDAAVVAATKKQSDPAPIEAQPVDAAPEAATPAPAEQADETADEAAAAHPALGPFYARIEEIELPGESVAVWMKHRHDLAPLPVADREAAWQALCKRTEEVGRMKNAKVWLKKAIAEEDARQGPSVGASTDSPSDAPGLASTELESLLADLGTARDTATLAATWEAITAGDYERATVAQRAQLDAARTAREKALRQPPPGGPKGTRTREASPPASAQGSGEQASANDAAPATMLHRVLDTDLAHLQIAGTWRATEAGWRDHLAAIVVRRHLMNCVASNGAALGPRFLTLAAARLVEVAEPDPTTGARLNIIGAMPLVESAALEASRDRARRAAERQAA